MRLYLDTNVWLYSFQASSPFFRDATALFHAVAAAGHQLVTSPVILGELLVLPRRSRDQFTEATYRNLFKRLPVIQVTDISAIADTFADLRAAYRLAPADALHLSLASTAKVDIFVTEDGKLLKSSARDVGSILTIQQAFTTL